MPSHTITLYHKFAVKTMVYGFKNPVSRRFCAGKFRPKAAFFHWRRTKLFPRQHFFRAHERRLWTFHKTNPTAQKPVMGSERIFFSFVRTKNKATAVNLCISRFRGDDAEGREADFPLRARQNAGLENSRLHLQAFAISGAASKIQGKTWPRGSENGNCGGKPRTFRAIF